MATSYTALNNSSAAVSQTDIDSATFSTPTLRPSAFTPTGGYVAPASTGQGNFGLSTNDWSMGSTPTVRPQVFEPPSRVFTLDPGMILNG